MCVLCNPCVCLCAIRVFVCGRFFIVNYVVFWACLKNCKGGHFIRVFTFKMTCSIRVCVFGVRLSPYLRGETQIGLSAPRRELRFRDTPQLSHTKRSIYPPTLVGVPGQICRSSEARGADPLEKAPGYVPKFAISPIFPQIAPAMCVSALKKGLKRPPCKSVCECVCLRFSP